MTACFRWPAPCCQPVATWSVAAVLPSVTPQQLRLLWRFRKLRTDPLNPYEMNMTPVTSPFPAEGEVRTLAAQVEVEAPASLLHRKRC